MAESGYRHWIDSCTQHQLDGWSTAPWLDIAVNDGRLARIVPDLPRDDLMAAGVGPGHGFRFVMPQPLWLDDAVSLHGPDGSVLRASLGDAAAARLRELTRHIDPARQVGLEIGPLDRPLIPRGRFRIYTLDQAPHDELLARYAGHGVEHACIVAPDFVSGAAPMAELVGSLRFDYAVASHVIEHIPDMVGWLWQIWSVLKPGGVLALAVPHGSHTFDAHRRLSSMAELAEAFFGRFTQPSPRQIIDAEIGSALFHHADLAKRTFNAVHLANHARKTALYVDVHCNVFTPDSFAGLLRDLDAVELLGFDLLSMGYAGGDEFTAHLRHNPTKMLPGHISP